MNASRSDIAKALFRLRDEPLSFEDHRYMIDILNDRSPKLLLKCSRQVGKSTIMSLRGGTNVAITNLGVKGIRQTYVTPSWVQTRTYVIEKLRPLFYDSPRFASLYFDKKTMNNIDTQTFRNGAIMFLRAAHFNADRVRGIPTDELQIDEIQDILVSSIPVMESSLDASKLGHEVMSGTPLSDSNPIEEFWRLSTQTEWVVPCHAHTPKIWNIPSVENIGATGFICKKCGKLLNTEEGRWIDTVPGAAIKGYHVSQLIVKLKQNPDRWKRDIVFRMEHWPEEKFHNEVLGISMGEAGRPFTTATLQAACHPQMQTTMWDTSKYYDSPPTKKVRWFAGVDWGEGREQAVYEGSKKKYTSFTIFTIGAYDQNGNFFVAHVKKFKGKEEIKPSYIVDYIAQKFREWNIVKIAADWGFGWGVNESLMTKLGVNNVVQCYHSSALKDEYSWDSDSYRYVLNRTAIMTHLIHDIQRQKVGFPKWTEFEPYAGDFLALFAEYNYNTNTIQYSHSIQEPDDAFHSLLYAKFVADAFVRGG